MKKSPISILIIDDQLPDLLTDLQDRCKDFKFFGIESFDDETVLQQLEDFPDTTVLLMDVVDATKRDPKAGIKLYKALGSNPKWQELRENGRSVQVVIFTNEPKQQHKFDVACERRTDLSGFVGKEDLYEVGRINTFMDVLFHAHMEACRFRQYPSLSDPIRKECQLIYSPNSHGMQKVWEQILLAGRCWEPVLIQGETGTGKELVAQAIDLVMKNTKWPMKKPDGTGGKMISYNIGSAPQEGNLQYTELFGAIKGAYSGCDDDRKGVFERASNPKPKQPGKTIFLDEIGDAPSIVQVALLRVLQEKKIIPLGGFSKEGVEIERPVNFRLITASHRGLKKRVEKDKFRADLYYRLNTIEIHVPPLRERLDDIPVLVYHFLEKLNKEFEEYGVGANKVIPPNKAKKIFELLKSYSWPGNVRQLESFIRRSYVMSPSNEFELSDDIMRLIEGYEPSSLAVIEEVRKIKDSLENNPTKLPVLLKSHGLPIAIEVARLVIDKECDGHMPDEEQAMKWFGMRYDACRKWINTKKIFVSKAKKNTESEE